MHNINATINAELPVEFLNDMLVRLIVGIHNGHVDKPVPIPSSNKSNIQNEQ